MVYTKNAWRNCCGLLSVAVFSLSGCGTRTPHSLAQVVLKEQIADADDGLAEFVLCITVDSKDADSALLASLQDANKTVVPGSECVWVMDPSKGSYHRPSRRKAMLLDVSMLPSRQEVEYEARHSGKWGTFRTLQVTEEQGHWKVIKMLKDERA